MSNRCSDADCKYPDCTCWEDKYSQSVERIAELEEIERRWNNIQPQHVIMIGDTGHYVNTAVHDRIAELKAALADVTQERDDNLQAVSNTIQIARKETASLKEHIAELKAELDAAFNKGMERAAKMTKHKIFYGQKWVNDNSVVLCSSKNRHSDPSLPMYEYIEYTKEVKESLESIAELKAERDRDRKDFIEINNVTVEDK